MNSEEKQISFENTNLRYSVSGKGLPVMLLHGFGEDASVWQNQVDFLNKNYQLIVPDLPGSGGSALLEKKNAGMEDYAACIKAIVDAEQIRRFVMIGHSMGGYVTLAFAEKYPRSLLGFGLFHSSAYADDAEKIETRKKAITFIQSNGVKPFLETSLAGLFFDTKKTKTTSTRFYRKATTSPLRR